MTKLSTLEKLGFVFNVGGVPQSLVDAAKDDKDLDRRLMRYHAQQDRKAASIDPAKQAAIDAMIDRGMTPAQRVEKAARAAQWQADLDAIFADVRPELLVTPAKQA